MQFSPLVKNTKLSIPASLAQCAGVLDQVRPGKTAMKETDCKPHAYANLIILFHFFHLDISQIDINLNNLRLRKS